MGDLLVVTGPPGAGKSTVAALLAEMFDPSALVAGDAFFAFLRRGAVPPWLPEAHEQNVGVLAAAAAAAGRLAQGRTTVVYDGVVGPWALEVFLASTGRAGLDYVVLLPNERVCLDRVATRRGHGFTDAEAARHMHGEFDRAAAGLDPRHLLREPPAPQETAELVAARAAAGALRLPG